MSVRHSKRTEPEPINRHQGVHISYSPEFGAILAIYGGLPCGPVAGHGTRDGVCVCFPAEQIPFFIAKLKDLQALVESESNSGERPEQTEAQTGAEVAKQ